MPLLAATLEQSRWSFHVTLPQAIVGLISALVVLGCVLFHYEVMSWSSRVIPRLRLVRRARIVVLILATLAAHVVEVWIFGLAYWALDHWPQLGQLQGDLDEGVFDFVYFSATSYTTLGFGDQVPVGAIRVLCGAESLVGLCLITWSASLAFLQMRRDWSEFQGL